MLLTSPKFNPDASIPATYTCQGIGINPPLTIAQVPSGAISLALIVDDPDSPSGTFTHWLMWNIAPHTDEMIEGAVPVGAIQGANDFGSSSYGGPCPDSGRHRYVFKLYALNTALSLPAGSSRASLEQAMQGHILDQAELIGTFAK